MRIFRLCVLYCRAWSFFSIVDRSMSVWKTVKSVLGLGNRWNFQILLRFMRSPEFRYQKYVPSIWFLARLIFILGRITYFFRWFFIIFPQAFWSRLTKELFGILFGIFVAEFFRRWGDCFFFLLLKLIVVAEVDVEEFFGFLNWYDFFRWFFLFLRVNEDCFLSMKCCLRSVARVSKFVSCFYCVSV